MGTMLTLFEGLRITINFETIPKRCENGDPATRDNVCNAALSQIEAKLYDHDLKQRGYTRILKYGIAFYGKGCTVSMNGSENI